MKAVTLVLCTAPAAEARQLADALLGERLVACVNLVGPMTSRYWWDGEIAESSEILLVMKTWSPVAAKLRRRISELHSHDVPEVLEFHADSGLAAYMTWVASSCDVSSP